MKPYDNLPARIKSEKLFCCWKYEQRNGKKTKVPYDPVTSRRAKTDRPETFRDYAAALAAVSNYDGIGFLVGGGICFLDLDNCFYETGLLKSWAQDTIDQFDGCYMEKTPSGKGLRIVFLAADFIFDKSRYYINNRKLGLEVYVAGATNRFVTLTGNVYQEGGVLEKADALQVILDKYMKRPAALTTSPDFEGASYLSDEEVISKAMTAKNGEKFRRLWEGDVSEYPSSSEADMAFANMLAFMCGRDIEQMNRIFRLSQLMRTKWDRPQSGSTYGRLTLEKAAAETKNIYTPGGRDSAEEDFSDKEVLGLLGTNSKVIQWKEPIPIDTIIPPEFPLDCYPATICAYAKALSEYTQTDPAMSGVILLGLLGTLFQNKLSIESVNGNVEQLSIYATAIAPPAERKSEVIRRSTNPLNKFEVRYNLEHRAEISRSKAQKKLLQKALAIAEKGDNPDALFKAQEAFDSYREPQPLTLVADDTTVEALVSLMRDNGERMLICSDEGGIFSHIKGRYKQNGDDTELYLKAHSGGRVSVHRKSREPDVLENPALSLCIAVQPYVVENSILDEENDGRGLTARFTYAYCEERAGSRSAVSGILPPDIIEAYENAVQKCLTKTINPDVLFENDYSTVSLIHLSDEAREYAISYFDITEKRIVEGLERAKGWNGKSFGLAIRIAGLFHSFECMENDKDPSEISIPLKIMENAAEVTEVLAVHAEKVFAGNDKKHNNALYLLRRIQALETDEFNKQDLWQKARRRFHNVEGFDEALQTLENNGYIRIEVHQTKGRPLTIIKVNPYVKCT